MLTGRRPGRRRLGVAGWLTLTLAVLIFLVVGTVGLFLILRTEPTLPAPRETSSDHSEEEDGDTEPETDCDETHERHRRHPIEQSESTRAHKALQPPRRR